MTCMEKKKWSSVSPCAKPKKAVAIKWTNLVCVKKGKNGMLVKTCSGNGWNAGAISDIGVRGDTSILFQCHTGQHKMIGFASDNAHNSYQDIDCAVYCDKGRVRIYENGRHQYYENPPSFDENDKFMITRVGSSVYYYHNGKVLRSCGQKLAGTVFADTSICHGNSKGFINAQFAHGQRAKIVHPVKWVKGKCVKGTGSGLTKNKCGTGWNGGAISWSTRKANTQIEFSCMNNNYAMIGFSVGADSHQSYQDIDCALYCGHGNTHVYERGAHRGAFGSYEEATVFSVKRQGTYIRYYKDGKLLR